MRYTTLINNVRAVEWKLNLPQAYFFAWLYELPSWAETVIVDGNTYYFCARQKVVEELPMLTGNTSTVYSHLKQLQSLGLVTYIKVGKKDFVRLTEKSSTWNEVGTQIEIRDSDNYPSTLRNISESNSEIYPRDKYIILDKIIKDKTRGEKIPSNQEFMDYAQAKCDEVGFNFDGMKANISLKYSAWLESGWKAGKTLRPIKNWKSTLSNTLQYLTNETSKSATSYGERIGSW